MLFDVYRKRRQGWEFLRDIETTSASAAATSAANQFNAATIGVKLADSAATLEVFKLTRTVRRVE